MQLTLCFRTENDEASTGKEISQILKNLATLFEDGFTDIAEEEGDLIMNAEGEAIGKWALHFDAAVSNEESATISEAATEETFVNG